MSEKEILLIVDLINLIERLVYGCCLAAFFYPIMTGRSEQSAAKLRKILIVFVIYSVIFSVGYFVSVYSWLSLLFVMILLVMVSRYLGIEKNMAFLWGSLFFSATQFSTLITETLAFITSLYFIDGAAADFKNTLINYLIAAFMRLVICSAMLFLISKIWKKGSVFLHFKELCYLCLMPVTGIVFSFIIRQMWTIIKEDTIIRLYEQYPAFLGLVPLAAVLFYLGIIATILSCQQMVKMQEEKQRFFVEEQQVYAMQERIEEVDQFYKGIQQIKHEMRGHLTNIKGLAESGNYEELEQYLAQMDENLTAFELSIKTGNTVTDVIVGDKKKAADKLGIKFQSDFSYPQSDKYNPYDIGIILNNLLTNALEACEKMDGKERYIILSGRQKKKFFLIEVKNSFEGEIVMNKETKLPISTKENDTVGKRTSVHGIGLSNVKREAEKYMGDVDIRIGRNEFMITVLLQQRNNKQ